MSGLRSGKRPGLYLSSCGRFTVRRLGGGAWMVSPLHSPRGSGDFSDWVGGKLLSQRFQTRKDATEALAVLLETSEREHAPVELSWNRNVDRGWAAEHGKLIVQAKKVSNVWNVTAMPAAVHQAMVDEESTPKSDSNFNSRFSLNMLVKANTSYLGSARTLSQVKTMVGQELAWQDAN